MQFSHAGNERLSGLLALDGPEGGILPLHHLQHVSQFLALEARLRFDRHRNDRLRKLDLFEKNGVVRIAERVAGDARSGTDHAHDIPGLGLLDLLPAVGLHVPELGDVFLLLPERIPCPAARLERARIDPHKREIAMLLSHDLEDKPAERGLRIGLPRDHRRQRHGLLASGELGRIDPLDRRHVGRTWQIPGHRVEHRLHADAVERRAAQHRHHLPANRRLANCLPDHLHGDRRIAEGQFGQFFGEVEQR